MTTYVALLRAVNVGGRQLKMADLTRIAEELKFKHPRTFIASGNLLFGSEKAETAVKAALEAALATHMDKTVEVMVRTSRELATVVKANPFSAEPGNRVVAIFLDAAPAKGSDKTAKNVADERIVLGKRELYVHYPSGQGRSKLVIPAAKNGTARNMNTVARLAALAKEVQ